MIYEDKKFAPITNQEPETPEEPEAPAAAEEEASSEDSDEEGSLE